MSTTVVDAAFRSRLTQVIQSFGSVVALATAVGVSDNAIYKWLAGRGQPSVANLVALARAARVSVEWLATGAEPTQSAQAVIARGRARRLYLHAAQPDSIFERARRDTAQRAGGGFDRVSRGLGQAGAPHGVTRLDPDRGGWRFDGADGRGLGFDPRQPGGAALSAGRNLFVAA